MPPSDGGTIAMYSITKGLVQAGHDVTLLAYNPLKSYIEIENIPSAYRICRIEAVKVNTNLNLLSALWSLLRGTSYNMVRFDQPAMHKRLADMLQSESFDVIHLESLFVSPLLSTIRKYSKAKVVLRSHNVEHRIWEGLSKKEKNPIKAKYLNILAKRLKKYESDQLNAYDAILPISKIDGEYYSDGTRGKVPLLTLPTGIDLDDYPVKPVKNEKSVCYIGAMDWQPNVQGVEWFLKNVWKRTYPFLKGSVFYLAGKKMPNKLLNDTTPQVVNLGEVADPKAFLSEHFLMVVPLFAGSGIRIKILEGMALGKPIIAHYHAAQGIDYTENKNLFIAYSNVDFAQKLIKCLDDPDMATELGRQARLLIETSYDNRKLMQQLTDFYATL